jgi:hypothetical protein
VLIYILYDQEDIQFANVCGFSLERHSPTALIKFVDKKKLLLNPDKIQFAPLLLASTHNDWFMYCQAKLLFLYSPFILLEYTHPNKTVLKVSRFDVFDSPILLWNGEGHDYHDAETINNADIQELNNQCAVGNIPNDWVGTTQCPNPKAILFDGPTDCDIWMSYHEAYTECSAN